MEIEEQIEIVEARVGRLYERWNTEGEVLLADYINDQIDTLRMLKALKRERQPA